MHILRYSVFSVLVLVLSCLSALGQAPKAYFSFDNNLTDTSGAGLGTTAVPNSGWTPAYTADRNGVANKALVIAGSQSLQLTCSTLLNNSNQALGLRNAGGTNTSFTLVAWVYFASAGSGQGYSTVFGNMLTVPATTTEVGTLHAGLNTGATTGHFGFNNANDVTGATTSLSTGIWYHVAFVYDTTLTGGSGTAPAQRIYINGIPEVTRWGVADTLRATDLFLGNWGVVNDASNDMKGRLDDVAIYSSALKGDQIQALADGGSPLSLPTAGTYSGPKLPGVVGTVGNWGVRELRGNPITTNSINGVATGTMVNADKIGRNYTVGQGTTSATEYQASVINFSDDENAGNLGYFPNEGDYGSNTAADDNYLVMVAKCAVRIPTAGDYTFGFRGDDGSRLRVLGKQFTSSTRLATANPADPAHSGDAIYFVAGTGDSNTLGVVNLAAGDYNLEFTYWEGSGGSSVEVFAAQGAKTSVDSAFQLIGNTAAGGLEIVRDPDTYPRITSFTVGGGSSAFVLSGSPATVTLAWATNSAALPAQVVSISPTVGTVAGTGTTTITSPATTTTYTLTSTNGADTATSTVTVYVNTAPIITSFTASDTTVTSGTAVTLNWASGGAASAMLQPTNVSVATTGSRVVNPTVTTIYTLAATNAVGTTQQQVTVNVAPAPMITSFTAGDTNLLFGAETTLNWSVSNFDTLSIDQGIGTITGATGTLSIIPYVTTTYTLTATNTYGSATASVTVNQPTPIGVNAAGFTARRVSSTVAFPFTGIGYLQSAINLLAGTNAGTPTTSTGLATVNFSDGADGDFTTGNSAFPGGTGDNFAVEITATLVVNTPGEYTFVVNCDDGCRLRIDGLDVIVDDGTHSPGGNSGRVSLTKSTATLQLVYYDATGSAEVELGWIRPNLQWTLLTTATATAPVVRGQVLISEFCADNTQLLDEDNTAPDWIEIWNSTNATVSLAGYYLSDDPLVPNKWALPAWTLGANQYAIVFASLKNRTPAQVAPTLDNVGTLAQPHLHTNFKLNKAGGYLSLKQDNGAGGYNTLTAFNLYPTQKQDVSYGSADTEGYVGYMEVPTPGQLNAATVSGFVADTVFSTRRGRYSAPFTLNISTATPGATIRYTTDGTLPAINYGTIYTGPLNVSGTAVIRAIAYRAGWKPTNVDTNTYLFVDDIVTQTTATSIARGFPSTSVNGQVFRYGVALANVTAGGGTLQSFKDALAAAPSVCVTTDIANLTNTSTGIYVNPSKRGLFWERPASMEYINTAGTSEFQLDSGIRIRGGASRSTTNAKHAFHMYFRNLYGGKLNYRLFGTEGASGFSQIDLRCEENYSWSKDNNSQNSLMREEWSRATQRDMGQPYGRNGYFHLYINGVYWGVYDFEERTEAAFGETYLGGAKDTTDTVKSAASTNNYNTEMTDGNFGAWENLYRQAIALRNDTTSEANRTAKYMQMRGLNATGTANATYPVLLDVDNLIDYLLVIFYDGSFDAPMSTFLSNASNNWFGVRDRAGTRGWAFFAHDNEHGMDSTGTNSYNRVGPWGDQNATGNNWAQSWTTAQYRSRETLTNTYYSKSNPQYLHEMLAYSAEYRQRFADRVHRHFFNGGALTNIKSIARVNTLAAQVDPIIHAEAARWGSTALHKNIWLNTAKATILNYMNNGGAIPAGHPALTAGDRTSIVLQQLKGYQDPITVAKALYPAIAAPTFSGNFGGLVAGPYTFTITNPNASGTLYYTINGTDPRPIGGGTAPGGTPTGASPFSLTLTSTATVRARIYDTASTTWSALTETNFILGTAAAASNLVISKIHYNPASTTDLEEYIELMNIGTQTIDLTGCQFTLGILYAFPSGTSLAPGARALIVRDSAAFSVAFPGVSGSLILGTFQNNTSLDNGGEQLQLLNSTGGVIKDFSYNDNAPWPTGPDGNGPALVLLHPELNPDPSIGANWRESANAGGDPGSTDTLSYTNWAALYGISDPLGTADPDGDGLTNLMEYALGADPLSISLGVLPTAGTQSLSVGGILGTYLTLTYTRVIGRDDVAYTVEYSNNLQAAWIPATLESGPTFNNNGTETLTYRAPLPLASETKQFLHLKMVR